MSEFDSKRSPGRLDPKLLTQFPQSSFAFEFLSRARIPEFEYIAPGVAAFTPETFYDIYSSEDPDSRRLAWISEVEPDEYPCLLFPSDDTVPRPASDPKFDKDWGFGRFTVDRRAGLYIDTDAAFGDGVQFVEPQGRTTTFSSSALHDAFGPARSPSLAGVLGEWEDMVRDGTWTVDEDGVNMDADWYEEEALASEVNRLVLRVEGKKQRLN